MSSQFRHGLVDLQSPSAPNDVSNENSLVDTSSMSFENSKLPRATLQQKIRVLDYHNASEKKCQQHTVNFFRQLGEFSITKSTMNRWVRGEKRLRQDYQNLTLNNTKHYKTRPKFRDPEINRCLEIYYEQLASESSGATERELLTKWSDFFKLYHNLPSIDQLPPKSNGWLHHFKKRNSLKRDLMSDFLASQSVYNDSSLADEYKRLSSLLSRYQPHQIFAIDEVSFHTRPSCFKANLRQPQMSITDPSERVIAGLCCNMDGSVLFDPLIVTDSPMAKNSGVSVLLHSKTGMLTSEIFAQYIAQMDDHLAKNYGQTCVLLLDDLPAHIFPTDKLRCIELVYYSSGLNKELYRPLDFGVTRIFKADVKHFFLQNCLKRALMGIESDSVADLFHFSKEDIIATITHSWSALKFNDLVISASFRNSGVFSNNQHHNTQHGYALRDTTKESQMLNIFNFFLEKGWLDESVLDSSRTHVLLDNYLFPDEEEVRHEHLEDTDIVKLVKREMADNEDYDVEVEDTANMSLNMADTHGDLLDSGSFDVMMPHGIMNNKEDVPTSSAIFESDDSREIGRIVLNKLKPFFTDPNVSKRYSKSAEKFIAFASTYVQETNDIFMREYRNGKHPNDDDNENNKVNGDKRRRIQYDNGVDDDNIDNQLLHQ